MASVPQPFERDMDLVRQILFWAEKGGVPSQRPGDVTVSLCYHVKILVEAGLIDGAGVYDKVPGTESFKPGLAHVKQLTWKGQEFLEAIRKDTIWEEVKAKVKEHGLPLVADLAKALALGLAAKAGLPLG